MRGILLILIFNASQVFAIGADECFLRAVVDNEEIILKNIEVTPPTYGLSGSNNYGYCEMDSGYSVLQCAEVKENKAALVYELDADNIDEQTYHCKSGCDANVAQKFLMVCEGD
jgi:hypothetical protein